MPKPPPQELAAQQKGPVPPENQPGHHPEHDQDKPEGPPQLPPIDHRFGFKFELPVAAFSRLLGVNDDNAFVHVHGDELTIRFGLWSLDTTLDNVADASVAGPYAIWKVAGPPRLSLFDRGVTFATTHTKGVCIRFVDPVPAALPHGLLPHPGVTVTVDDCDELARLLDRQAKKAAA